MNKTQVDERIISEGNPSQKLHTLFYIVCALSFWLIIPIFLAIWKYMTVSNWNITITNQRIIEKKGVLSKTTHEIELYRIKDIILEEPFFLRIAGLSNIFLLTSTNKSGGIRIPGWENGEKLRETLRNEIEIQRDIKGVRVRDLE